MRNRKSIDVLAVMVCIVAVAVIALSVWHLPPKIDSTVFAEMGRALAKEASAALQNGGRMVVICRDTETYRQPAMEIGLNAFQSEAVKAGVTVVLHPIQVDPLRAVEVPPGDFYEAIRRAKTNDVIVSFLGPPILDPDQQAKLTGAKPKIVALCTGTMAEHANLNNLARRGLLHSAIVNRQPPTPNTSETSLTFDQLYRVVRDGEFAKLHTSPREM